MKYADERTDAIPIVSSCLALVQARRTARINDIVLAELIPYVSRQKTAKI